MISLESPETTLLVVDLQLGFDDARWGRRNNPSLEQRAAQLLGAWRAAGRPVVHVRHMSTEPSSPLRPGQPGNAFKPETAPVAGEAVIEKRVNSAFIGTTLEADLRRTGGCGLVIVGLTTNHCVSTTARMAGNLGFATWVVSDATATFDRVGPDGVGHSAENIHAVALADLHGEFATVVDTAAVIAASNVAVIAAPNVAVIAAPNVAVIAAPDAADAALNVAATAPFPPHSSRRVS
jgi:nicotinamidase-related amidase